MQSNKDNERFLTENAVLRMAAITLLGDRREQQDSFGYELEEKAGIIAVCDGMGGMKNGRQASRAAVEVLLQRYREENPFHFPGSFLQACAQQANDHVLALRNKDGSGRAGTTLVCIMIQDHQLHWLSVGDSRGYLFRGEEYIQFTLDHNYGTVLMEQLQAGYITEDQYEKEKSRAEALVSFIGIDSLKLLDQSREPIVLQSGDRILITTDGLYRQASDVEIFRIVHNFGNPSEALRALENRVSQNSLHTGLPRDNITAALIVIK